MQLSVTGISHHSAPVALRERFAFSAEELPPALELLRARFGATAFGLRRGAPGARRPTRVRIVGAGEAGRLAPAPLTQQGAGRLPVTPRPFDRARDIAAEPGGSAPPFEALPSVPTEADIV